MNHRSETQSHLNSYANMVLFISSLIYLGLNFLDPDLSHLAIGPMDGIDLVNLGIVTLCAGLTWPHLRSRLRTRSSVAFAVSLASFALSFLLCRGLRILDLAPGDLYRSWISPILFAPLIEELAYRYMMWMPLERRIGGTTALLMTSSLFSLAHLSSYFLVEESHRGFILTQGAYTFVFALVVGTINLRTRSLTNTWLAHVCANIAAFLGFYGGL